MIATEWRFRFLVSSFHVGLNRRLTSLPWLMKFPRGHFFFPPQLLILFHFQAHAWIIFSDVTQPAYVIHIEGERRMNVARAVFSFVYYGEFILRWNKCGGEKGAELVATKKRWERRQRGRGESAKRLEALRRYRLAADIQSVWASTQTWTWNIKWHRPGETSHPSCPTN